MQLEMVAVFLDHSKKTMSFGTHMTKNICLNLYKNYKAVSNKKTCGNR